MRSRGGGGTTLLACGRDDPRTCLAALALPLDHRQSRSPQQSPQQSPKPAYHKAGADAQAGGGTALDLPALRLPALGLPALRLPALRLPALLAARASAGGAASGSGARLDLGKGLPGKVVGDGWWWDRQEGRVGGWDW